MPSHERPASAASADDGAPRAPIRVLIADDHAIVRIGLRALIATEPGMEVVGEAVDGLDAVRKARSLRPDVIVLDLVMPHKDGIEATMEITREDPSARILVLTSFAEDDKLVPALKAGAVGYLLKDSAPRDLLQAIRDVAQGASSLHPQIAHKLIREISRPANRPPARESLTEREREVARLGDRTHPLPTFDWRAGLHAQRQPGLRHRGARDDGHEQHHDPEHRGRTPRDRRGFV
jgi:two-component system, NarL family, response regulator LiaR